jgi:hypothetical protein
LCGAKVSTFRIRFSFLQVFLSPQQKRNEIIQRPSIKWNRAGAKLTGETSRTSNWFANDANSAPETSLGSGGGRNQEMQ